MIIEIYIMIQCLIILLMFFGWKDNHPMFWVLGFIFSSLQVFSSYNIEYVVMVLSDSVLTAHVMSLPFPILSYINIMLAGICLLMFFWDLFSAGGGLER